MLQQGGIPRGRPVQELIPELNRRVVTIPIHKRRAHCVAARLSIPQRHGAARPAFASFFISNRQNQQKKYKGFIIFRPTKYLCSKISPPDLTTVQKQADFFYFYTSTRIIIRDKEDFYIKPHFQDNLI